MAWNDLGKGPAIAEVGSGGYYKIVAPVRSYNGMTMGVQFKNGIGYTNDLKVANRLTWDFHYESQPDRRALEEKYYGSIVSGTSPVAAHLAKLERALDAHDAREDGAPEAWLRGRVREVTELVALG